MSLTKLTPLWLHYHLKVHLLILSPTWIVTRTTIQSSVLLRCRPGPSSLNICQTPSDHFIWVVILPSPHWHRLYYHSCWGDKAPQAKAAYRRSLFGLWFQRDVSITAGKLASKQRVWCLEQKAEGLQSRESELEVATGFFSQSLYTMTHFSSKATPPKPAKQHYHNGTKRSNITVGNILI